MVLVQIIMAMIARATPTLNLFSVGLPVTLSAGIVLLAIATPAMAEALVRTMTEAMAEAARIAQG